MAKARKKRQNAATPADSRSEAGERFEEMTRQSSVGVFLREIRRRQGLSYSDIHTATRISTKALMAIEDGDHDALPSEVYGSALVAQYAKTLGLDGRELAARFLVERGAAAGLGRVRDGLDASELAEATIISPATNALLLFCGIALAIGIFIASTGWNPLGYIFHSGHDAASAPEMSYHPANPGTSVEATSKAITLEVRFLKDTGVRIKVDGEQEVQVTYTRESAATWEANETLVIEFTEPASAELRLNGQPQAFPPLVNGLYTLRLRAAPDT